MLSPDGKVAHAREQARTRQARQALQEAARAIERARTSRGRKQGDRAIAEWTGLIAARWSLVDHFESDGKRYLLARRNDVADVGTAALSPRELQAVAFAALGHNNKLIAYEMGITAETVRVLLHRAARKLGARDRAALITRARLTFTPTRVNAFPLRRRAVSWPTLIRRRGPSVGGRGEPPTAGVGDAARALRRSWARRTGATSPSPR